jgi:ABC-type methionine transport system ATPase subunit
MTVKRKFHCIFTQHLIQEPLLYNLGRNFRVVPNIRKAQVDEDKAVMTLELEGEGADVEGAIAWLKEKGADIQPIES